MDCSAFDFPVVGDCFEFSTEHGKSFFIVTRIDDVVGFGCYGAEILCMPAAEVRTFLEGLDARYSGNEMV